ncbi:SSI family serine proteinase inhibitor [Salinactinospora qingdaonensis]|uniref:Protease inhibitor n=1 Tax=Salinactinospora qingdaonensis TaxID=702744 RepID=A0ABP7F900_9ACTN
MRTTTTMATLGALTLTAVVGAAAPAAAEPAWGPFAVHTFTMYEGEGTSGPVLSQVTLECYPTDGTHPSADEACSTLTNVWGDFENLPQQQGVPCYDVWAPVTVTAQGHWFNQSTDFERTYSNDCDAAVISGRVFDF